MSEDQAVSSPVDVAAIRAALEAATPGPWRLESPRISLVDHDAALVVLLRNNAEALLRMLDDGYCAGYDHGVEDQTDRQEAALVKAERRCAAFDKILQQYEDGKIGKVACVSLMLNVESGESR